MKASCVCKNVEFPFYGESIASEKFCTEDFKSKILGKPTMFEEEELETVFNEDSCQTQKVLPKTL